MKSVVISDHSSLGLGYLAASYFSYFANNDGQCSLELKHKVETAVFHYLERALVEDNLLLEKNLASGRKIADPQVLIIIDAGSKKQAEIQTASRVYYIVLDAVPTGLIGLDDYRGFRDEIKREILRIIGKEELVR